MNTDDSSYLQQVGTEHIFQKIKSILTKETIGLGNVENKSSATILSELTSSNVTTALGFTPVSPSEAVTKDSSGNITATDFITTGGVTLSDINTKISKISLGIFKTTTNIPNYSMYVSRSTNMTWDSGTGLVAIPVSYFSGKIPIGICCKKNTISSWNVFYDGDVYLPHTSFSVSSDRSYYFFGSVSYLDRSTYGSNIMREQLTTAYSMDNNRSRDIEVDLYYLDTV